MFEVLLDPSWILSVRSDSLTRLMKFFPYVTNEYVYLLIIALGYWCRPQQKTWVFLTYLMPFSVILNGILKNVFLISRPLETLWLVSPMDKLGFPSGDVQLGVVFWGMLLLQTRLRSVKLGLVLLLFGIAASRVYLGVHSIFDVLAGGLVGILTISVWHLQPVQRQVQKWWLGRPAVALLSGLVLSGGYFILAPTELWTSVVILAVGVLCGSILSMFFMMPLAKQSRLSMSFRSVSVLLLGVVGVVGLAKFIPSVKSSMLLLMLTGLVKYSLVMLWMLFIMPYLKPKLQSKEAV